MRSILLSLMTIALVGALVGGGVFAYFSDTETSTGNTFTAGTLDLNLDAGNTNVVKFTVSDVKPGDSRHLQLTASFSYYFPATPVSCQL